MKSSNDFKYHFDWKSVYLVPLMTFAISITLIFAVVKTSEKPEVLNYTKNANLIHKTTNLLADTKIL